MKHEKHGKPGKFKEFEKLSKSQGKLREICVFVGKNLENSGEMKILTITNDNVFE